MNKKLETAIAFAGRALKEVPDDAALVDAKRHMSLAMKHMESVLQKRNRRSASAVTPAEKWKFDLETGQLASQTPWQANQAKSALTQIEAMISKEKAKSNKEDDAPLGTILG